MKELSTLDNYRLLRKIAWWKIFKVAHRQGMWWPMVPILALMGFTLRLLLADPLANDLLWFALLLYLLEIPLIIFSACKAGRVTIGKMYIEERECQHVQSGLEIAGLTTRVTKNMPYVDFVIAGMAGDKARVARSSE